VPAWHPLKRGVNENSRSRTKIRVDDAGLTTAFVVCSATYWLVRHDSIDEGRLLPMTKCNIIVVGTSVGGVEALCKLNTNLPRDLDASVFVVMHIGTEAMSPQMLSQCGNLSAVTAEHEKRYKRGCIYCAPAQHHLSIKDGMTILSRGPRENGHRPAVDVLFRSAARTHRSKRWASC
jgi:chemotaxis response regulator CheB